MKTIYMIHGFIGAGKTTFSKKLEKETGAILFSPDDWMIDLYGINPPKEKFKEYDVNIKKLIWKNVVKLIANDQDVILDYGFWRRADRDEMRKAAIEIDAKIILYTIICPTDMALNRTLNRTNILPAGALYINKDAFYELKAMYEPIEPDEDAITIDNNC